MFYTPSRTFVMVPGQEDNIGDIVLRRRMLQAYRGDGEYHIYVGKNSRLFQEALGIEDSDFVYSRFLKWWIFLVWFCIRHGANIVHNPGEVGSSSGIGVRTILREALIAPTAVIARFRGGDVRRIGLGLHGGVDERSILTKLYAILTICDSATVWRESVSQKILGRGAVAPDWAFDSKVATGSQCVSSQPRPYLTISMRYDREVPHQDWIEAVWQVAGELNLEIIVISQVKRDNGMTVELANRLMGRAICWVGQSHLEHEHVLREIYSKSEILLSDRLHALILGVGEGAVPVGTIFHEDVKVARNFAAAGIEDISFDARQLNKITLCQRIREIHRRKMDIGEAGYFASKKVREL